MDQCDVLAEAGQERRLLHGTVAPSDDHDVLVLEEETVAGRAPADALAGQARLTVDPELAVRRAGGDDQRLRAVDSAVVEGDGLDRSLDLQVHRSEEHTSELQSRGHLVCRLLLEKKKQTRNQ